MKLAEALILRSDVQKRIEQLRERLKLSVLVQEGESPPEDPAELMAEAERLLTQLTALIQRINHANLTTRLPDGRTVTDALAERDGLTLRHSVLASAVDAATPKMDRLGRMEIKKVATVRVAELRRQMDAVARERRELDTLIQSVNWNTDLSE